MHDNDFELLDGPPYGHGQPTGRRHPTQGSQLLAPVVPSKIFYLGRNYDAHRTAMGYPINDSPSVFMKGPSTIIGPGQHIVLPPTHLSNHVEHEAELAVVIGTTARNVSAADARPAGGENRHFKLRSRQTTR
jgi:2-keto-4-pentenoate hydratase/2-oxohepta-3-ene-1,7-dioic acid hydratase in catechol pathway